MQAALLTAAVWTVAVQVVPADVEAAALRADAALQADAALRAAVL